MTVEVRVVRLPHGDGLALPAYATAGAAGADLLAAVERPVVLAPGKRETIPTGIALALPEGFEAQVRPRSGLALSHGVTVLNAPGTIDCDYRGEVRVILVNLGEAPFVVERGMRIAQIVVQRIEAVRWRVSDELPASARGPGGFGSTGTGGGA
ncbi:MAG: dUTP diphosphatase [Alphaproteobacteria bacterium]|nr:dUTP diphosphatase [Alphaproteobacteria bacterium]MBM3731866.1 dUTP diphosphatase [Acidimicrobiia bacterium]